MNEFGGRPRITVITPSLNQGAYLDQCVRSVIEQGYPNLEYFVIDGGSTDETLSIIKRHGPSIDYWVSEADSGQSDAINTGLSRASGELVAWLNADDYYLPGALDRVAEAYARNPGAPFYFGDGVRVDATGSELGRFCPADRLSFDRDALLIGLNYILQPATFIHRETLKTAGLLDTSLHYGLDSDLWMRLSSLGNPFPIQAILAATREYAATKTASGLFGRIEELRQISHRHSGLQITPGVLCYFLDTLNRYAKEREDIYPPAFLTEIVSFWARSAKLLERIGAGADGFPRTGASEDAQPETGVGFDRRLKIGIDLRQLVLGASGGISQLVKGVYESLFALYPQHQFLVFCTVFNRSLLDCTLSNVRSFSLSVPTFFAEIDQIMREESVDVLIRSYPMEDTLSFPLEKQIVLIPDIQHEIYPEFFSAKALRTRRVAFSRALGKAGAIGTISEFSKKTLRDFPGTRCRDIFLMPPSLQNSHVDQSAGALSASELALVPQGNYFLFPANLWRHKNHLRVLQAFRRLVEKTRRDITLVLTGHPDGWPELAAQFPGLPVRHVGFVRPELMRVLFKRARALVFFSLYEGFGIPLLEAFDAGIPAICSNITSLPEVGGDAVLTCDPTDVDAMAALMERILSDGTLCVELVRRGKARLNGYSWERSAHALMQACTRVAERDRLPAQAPAAVDSPLPLVSIVTPSYNQARFILRTINSVLGQTYPNLEYLVVDGGSSDESVDILRSFGERVAWVSEADLGQANAINKGMARMQGEILAYLNSDDVLLPGTIARVVRFFQENPDCDMVYGDADYIDEGDRVTGVYATANYSFLRLMEDCMVCQPAAFWRRRIADKVGPFNEQLHYAMDYDYWQRIDRAGGVIRYLPEKLACSRLYPQTKTLSARSAIYHEIFRVCKANAGFARHSFFFGYWHHLAHERNTVLSRVLRQFPDLIRRFSWLHHKWFNRDRYTRDDVVDFLYGGVKQRIVRIGRRLRSVLTAVTGAGPVGNRVTGYMTDNWLAPLVTMPPRRRAPGHVLHLAGVAPMDVVMTLRAGKTVIGRYELVAHQYQMISFTVDSVRDTRVVIQFSDYFVDSAKRRVSFRLQDTNLFAEHETH